ncbi:anaerobic ribonucleoside-triphosphate reductase activating protein [Psychrobacter jeotgali]|uniref:anaerobic ribonucleoside-triphosphate reductase activating protein n=1 Tax=Psychrobacter jeotgali TaxID=179010 RepID=UPI00191A3D2B|nr:anaerobic ribonucleoside-triphosphate reductase activating protein [Psychrobacter jeotgali]
MLNIVEYDIVFQEVPAEVSLALTVAGCPLMCRGCSRADTWKTEIGTPLTDNFLADLLERYTGLISCVLFMGGEWQPSALLSALQQVRQFGLKTALYTGLDEISAGLQAELTYLKTGPWIIERGGLDTPTTNQRFINCTNGEVLNHLFWRDYE